MCSCKCGLHKCHSHKKVGITFNSSLQLSDIPFNIKIKSFNPQSNMVSFINLLSDANVKNQSTGNFLFTGRVTHATWITMFSLELKKIHNIHCLMLKLHVIVRAPRWEFLWFIYLFMVPVTHGRLQVGIKDSEWRDFTDANPGFYLWYIINAGSCQPVHFMWPRHEIFVGK